MSFTTPCFVRVEDSQERKKLLKWLENIGYIFNNRHIGDRYVAESKYCKRFYVVAGVPHIHLLCDAYNSEPKHGDYINCGTNIALFKALAAMNDENDYMQLFIHRNNKYAWVLCNTRRLFDCIPLEQDYRKATADEIIEVFKKVY